MGSPRVGSNPTGVDTCQFFLLVIPKASTHIGSFLFIRAFMLLSVSGLPHSPLTHSHIHFRFFLYLGRPADFFEKVAVCWKMANYKVNP